MNSPRSAQMNSPRSAQMNSPRSAQIINAARSALRPLLFCVALLGHTLASAAANAPGGKFNYPGGVVELYLAKESGVLPQVNFGTHEPVIIQQTDFWRILIGLSLDTLPGEYIVYVKEFESELPAHAVKFDVTQKPYPVLEISEQRQPEQILHSVMSDIDFNNTEQPNLPLLQPVNGRWEDLFGHIAAEPEEKIENSSVRGQNYVSLTTTELANVVAPQNAIVSRIEYGNDAQMLATVFLDHGRGLYSIIAGLTDLTVDAGDGIVAGAVIGKLPENPDGPSVLIWQCVTNGVFVNPLIMTRL